MNDWFEWNGVRCTEYGMHVLAQPSIISPGERLNYQTVPGRSGSLLFTKDTGVYDDLVLACTCVIDDPYMTVNGVTTSRIEAICKWLEGGGNVTFADRPEGFYRARVNNQVSFDKIVRGNPHRSFQVQFRCSPFFYLDSGIEKITFTGASSAVSNPGNFYSEPLLKIIGAGEGTIMCGESSMIVTDFTGLSHIMVDCEAAVAYKGAVGNPSDPLVLLGTRVIYNQFTIPSGNSFFSIVGGITSVEVTPRWRSR